MVRTICVVLSVLFPCGLCEGARAACDDLVDNLIIAKLRPVIAELDCSVLNKAGLDKKDHKLAGVCYQSTGATSEIRIDTQLRCHSSDQSVPGRLLGGSSVPSASEDVTAEAKVRGSDCFVIEVVVKPSGELGKLLAKLFDANGKAREALQQALTQACGR